VIQCHHPQPRATDLLFVFSAVFFQEFEFCLPWRRLKDPTINHLTKKSLMRHGKLSATDLLSRQINHQYISVVNICSRLGNTSNYKRHGQAHPQTSTLSTKARKGHQ
jgi:hypothetical protein